MKLIIRLIACCCFLTSLAGCSDISLATRRGPQPDRELQWPPLPMPSRITWVREIGNYRDLGIAKGFWQRVVDFVAGEANAGFGKPYGVFVDDRDRVFIVDVGLGLIHVMDQPEKLYSVIGAGKVPAFRTPIAVTEDDGNNLYITDAGTGIVYRYGLESKKLERFSKFLMERPTGITFNRQNRLLYVSDTASHQVVVIDMNGNERMRIGTRGTGPGQFNYPTDLVVDKEGALYVTDALNARVQIFSPQGRFKSSIGKPGDTPGSFAKPKGVAVDSDGHIYVCDAMFDAVQIFDQAGRVLLDFGSHGAGAGQFWMPSGLFIDKNDFIYVSDSYNRRIQVFKYLKVDEPVTRPSVSSK
ncbi:MAG TPA: 6-bladed beta-propeller [Geobacter sp.]|nr:6-bladed beta-propeller [Geobacter sp.]